MTITTEAPEQTRTLASRLSFSDPAYGDAVDFLTYEALLLDTDRQREWLGLLTTDVSYTLPVRETLYRSDGSGVGTVGSMTLDDNHMTLQMRVKRNVEIQYAFDRDPPPRTRRVVTNVSVFRTENPDEYDVVSYLLFLRNQYDLVGSDMLTATREDVLRRTDDGLRLARRRIIIDVCTLPEPFPNVLF